MNSAVRNYALVTGAYWGFTLTDGALRMLVLLHFDRLGYSAVQIAFLFLFYEFFGIVTNLLGGWIAARSGLKVTLYGGLGLQIGALIMLAMLQPAMVTAGFGQLCDGGAGALGYRQGPDQDERQERDQSRCAPRRRRRAVQMGCAPDRLEERAQGSRLLHGRRPAGRAGIRRLFGGDGGRLGGRPGRHRDGAAGRKWARPKPRSNSPSCFPRAPRSTGSQPPGCSYLARATSGSWSGCRFFWPPPWDGRSGRSALSPPRGLSATASCRRLCRRSCASRARARA